MGISNVIGVEYYFVNLVNYVWQFIIATPVISQALPALRVETHHTIIFISLSLKQKNQLEINQEI